MTWIELGGTWFVVEQICAVYDDPDGINEQRCAVYVGAHRRTVCGMTAEDVVDRCVEAARLLGR